MTRHRYFLAALGFAAVLLGTGCGPSNDMTPIGSLPTPNPSAPPEPLQENFLPVAPYEPNYFASLSGKFKWGKTALTYSVDKGADSRDLAILQEKVDSAANRWSRATNSIVTFSRIEDSNVADIKLRFVPSTDPDVSGSEAGDAEISSSGTADNRDTIVTATIKIEANLPTAQLPSLLAHELGHALGIAGHSPVQGDTMFPSVEATTKLTKRDANTIGKMYLTTD